MSKREIAAIIALMIAGFVAYEVVSHQGVTDRDEVAPGETPQLAPPSGEAASQAMKALVPAVRAAELHAALRAGRLLPELPAEAGLLAVAGNPGELFFTRRYARRTEVCVMRTEGVEVIWTSATERILEIVGAHGSELLVKFVDEPFDGPADAWRPGGFYALDTFALELGLRPYPLDDETVADVRRYIK